MRELLSGRLRGARSEAGLTIVEVLVATVVLVMGAGATYGLLGAATKNNQRAKATQVSLEIAQEELERLSALPYRSISLNTPPESSAEPLNPGSRVAGEQFALERSPQGEYGQLVVDDEFGVNPESPFLAGDPEGGGIEGTVYRYVVWRDDPTCPEEECPGNKDYKQIVVAVKPDKPVFQSGERGYVEVQSHLIDPAVYDDGSEPAPGGDGGGAPNPGEDVTAQQFFLSDTPCSGTPPTLRTDITADHPLHNTLGICRDGPRTGSADHGAPDSLLLNVAPDPDPADEANPPLYDYSDDFYLEPTPDTDRGLQIQRDDTSGCHYQPTGTTNPESQVHRWVTDPVAGDFVMDGEVTLEFYTRTLNDALYPGKLCVYLFDRSEAGSPPTSAEDSLLFRQGSTDPYWTYVPEGTGYWPRNYWTRVRLTMSIAEAPYTIPAGDRLGVALSVDRGGTPPVAIPVIYDHPNYPTRIEVETDTPIESGEEEAEGG